MKLNSVGEIFAYRDLLVSGSDKRVRVSIGKPEQFPDETDYYCPYQITGLGRQRVSYAGGIDGVQALILALEIIGAKLYTSKEAKGRLLSWEGATNGILGFSVPANLADIVPHPD